jgi:glycosyltransferase involved in cell wall biosynthesis
MKVAVVHEWLSEWAGSERVLAQILACFPDADLYSLVDSLSPTDRRHIGDRRARTSFIARLPFSGNKPWRYLPLMPLAIEQFDLTGYDLVISSCHAVAKGVITGPDQVHVSYVHSPMRYAWDLQPQYLRGSAGRGLRGMALRSLLHYLRMWDVRTANGVDAFAANSAFVARRIWKVYRRQASVIHPPVEISKFPLREQKEDFYLCASRLMPYKRMDIVVAAFAQMTDRRLIVIGDGPEYKSLKRLAGPNVTLMGYQPGEVLADHLQRARALVFAAQEDFGILPVEAQACGTPVIAFGKGGVREIVRGPGESRPTGLFFERQSPVDIVSAVEQFERQGGLIRASDCRSNAERFSIERFRAQFHRFVTTAIAQTRGGQSSSSNTASIV